jgi:hypothetical protein
MSRFKQINFGRIKTIPVKQRNDKFSIAQMAKPVRAADAALFFDSLPGCLKAADLIEFILSVVQARKENRPFHLLMGAHVVKVGLSPVIIDLMATRAVTGISMNSAGLIHDLELAFNGSTSEDVLSGLEDGSFGMAAESGRVFAGIVALADRKSIGLGEAAGVFINSRRATFREISLFAAADRMNIPATVHIAIGTDIVHQHKSFKAAPAAEASYRDFKILANILADADQGGAVANIGSAVILPEVFLKALSVARNIKKHKRFITTANFDMISHYRPTMNVVSRPTLTGGKGFNFIGHHEIMIPLLAWGLKTYLTEHNQETE